MKKVGVVGLGYWGPNLARNFDELGALAALCDRDEALRERFAKRYPSAEVYADFDELLADDSLDGVVIATPVPTHYPLARAALAAGKHVLVEKPPAMRGSEMEELVSLAESSSLTLMPGHLLLYHPGVSKLKELVDTGELGDVLCVYGNRQNLGKIRKDENALWSLGVHDLSVILYLLDEEPSEAIAHGRAFLNEGVEDVVFCYLRFPSGTHRAHAPVVARPAQDAPHHRRRPREDGRLRRHGARPEGDDLRQGARVRADELRRVADAHRRRLQPEDPERRAAKLECQTFLELMDGGGDSAASRATASRSCARSNGSRTLEPSDKVSQG